MNQHASSSLTDRPSSTRPLFGIQSKTEKQTTQDYISQSPNPVAGAYVDDANPITQLLELHAPKWLRPYVRELITGGNLLEDDLPALHTFSDEVILFHIDVLASIMVDGVLA